MTTKPVYDKERTDNIEVLFKIVFYAQLVDNCSTETKVFKQKLMREFDQFPVEFDKHRKASRYANPYRYNESGIVTMNGHNYASTEYVALEPWTPDNRPQPVEKTKKKVNRKPSYNHLLVRHPIWFLQLMYREGRKTVAHRNNQVMCGGTYSETYQKNSILEMLPEDERAPFESPDKYVLDAGVCKRTIEKLNPLRFKDPNHPILKMRELVPFFFLTDDEMTLLANALVEDNLRIKNNRYAHYHPNTDRAINVIIENPTAERKSLCVQDLHKITTKITAQDPNVGYEVIRELTVLEHDVVWKKLHEQYLDLDESHVHVLRELYLLNDDLLNQLKTEKEQEITNQ